MEQNLIYLDTYVLQQDMRIRMPKSILENMDVEKGISKFKIYYDKLNSQLIMRVAKDKDEEKQRKTMRIVSLFSGIGGFELGIRNSKLDGKVLFSSEIDKYATASYLSNFSDNNLQGDITKISEKDIPDHDLLVAGFPCQAFSIAGMQKGFADTRGTLFFDVARILKEKQPKAFILENVKGLTNHDGGNTLEVIINTIKEIGYDCKYKVLNARNYNVPQNRERWYCIGVKKESGINIEDFNFPEPTELVTKLSDIIEQNIDTKDYVVSETCERNIRTHVEKKSISINQYTLAYDIRPSRCHFVTKDYSNCLTAKMGTGGSNVAVVIEQNRKLTERECLRLMGFPDDYKIGKGYQAYKQIGNSVVVPVISELAKELVELCDF